MSPIIMNATTDAYLDQQKYADLTLIPTYGVTDEDIKEIAKIDGVEAVEGIYFFDVQVEMNKDYDGMVVYSLSNQFNLPYIVEGRNLKNENECLIDYQYKLSRNLQLNDTLEVYNDNGSKELTIVGFVKDVRQILYYKRGQNTYGNGTTQGFIIMHPKSAKPLALNKDLIDLLGYDEFYNEALIKVYDVDEMVVFNDEYDSDLNLVEQDIQEVIEIRLNKTYQQLIKEKKELLAGPLKEYENGLASYEKGKLEFDKAINEASLQLIEGKIAILEGRKQLVEAQSQFTGIDVEIEGMVNGFKDQLNTLYSQLNDLKDKINQENSQPDSILPDNPDLTIPDVNIGSSIPNYDQEEIINDVNRLIDQLANHVLDLQDSLTQLNQLASGLIQLQNAQLQLDKAEIEIAVGEQKLALQKELGLEELENAKKQLDDAKIQLDEAQAQLDLIPKATYYLLDQNMNEGIASFNADSSRIAVLGEVFPLMFFLVAALVCLTTMTRMVEEQRSQSGTLRALGYSKFVIIMQYVVYAIFPTFLGSIIGYFFGTFIFPFIIFTLYAMMMYDVPIPMIYCFDFKLCVLSVSLAVLITLFATLFSCVKEMSHVPSVLMRPKAPKLGKRILLERINWLWKRMSFNQKVTMRNIFRYKKRFLMSVVGIAGCSGLILTGFGIQYSITDMTVYQYEELMLYDGTLSFKNSYSLEDTLELRDDIKKAKDITEILFTSQYNAVSQTESDSVESIIMIPSSSTKLNRFINLRDIKHKEPLMLDDSGAIISQKLSEMLEVEIGDTFTISIDDKNYEIIVSGICENYIAHYVYMSSEYAKSVFNTEIKFNSACFNIDDTNDQLENQIGRHLMKLDDVTSVSFMSDAGGSIVTSLKSVSIITVVLIIAAGLLAFVVLYNLTNININERISEIATIKVLGFKDHEVYDYVFRENIILSMIGTLFGLVFGFFLHKYIMSTVEVELIMFVRNIKWVSYIYSIILTMLFTFIINRYMRRVLDRVDMVTSLKSIE